MPSPLDSRQRRGRFRRATGLTVLLVVAAALAGCPALSGSGPTATETPAATPPAETAPTETDPAATATAAPTDAEPTADAPPSTGAPSLLAEKGVDSNATWNRTLQIVGYNATRPSVAVSVDPVRYPSPSYLSVLTGPQPNSSGYVQARYSPDERLLVIPEPTVRSASGERLEAILVQGYAHAVQAQQDWSWRNVQRAPTAEPLALQAHSEGFASHVEGLYAERHPDLVVDRNLTEQYERATTFERHRLGGDLFGSQHFDRRVTETGSLATAAEEPPATTERILHNTTDEPRPLEVRTNASGNWSVEASNPRGELATRIALRDELPRERAIRAAAGWGADRLYRLESTGESGHAWVHRWDTAADAEEFASAAEALLEERRTETDVYEFDLKHPTPETTVLVFGTEGVPASTTVTAPSNGTVSLRAGN